MRGNEDSLVDGNFHHQYLNKIGVPERLVLTFVNYFHG